MPILKKMHYYRLKEKYKKTSRHIPEIVPHKNLTVSDIFFNQYEEIKPKTKKE